MNVYLDGKEQDSPRKDDATGAATVISYPHSEMHEGSAYHVDINTDDLKNEGDNNALHIKIVTPDTAKWGHVTYSIWASGEADFLLTEAPTGGASGGDAITPINRDRNSSNVSTMTVTTDDTAPTGGLQIQSEVIGSGKSFIDSAGGDRHEHMLKSNTIYSLRLSTTIVDIRAQMSLDWYEHTNKK